MEKHSLYRSSLSIIPALPLKIYIAVVKVDANDPTAARSFPFQLSNAVDKFCAKCVHKDCVPWEDSPHSGASKSIHDGSIICLQKRKKIKIMSSTMRSLRLVGKPPKVGWWRNEERFLQEVGIKL
eukprot:scaffold20215_cov191-Skeletonema_marinoi.AAC.4